MIYCTFWRSRKNCQIHQNYLVALIPKAQSSGNFPFTTKLEMNKGCVYIHFLTDDFLTSNSTWRVNHITVNCIDLLVNSAKMKTCNIRWYTDLDVNIMISIAIAVDSADAFPWEAYLGVRPSTCWNLIIKTGRKKSRRSCFEFGSRATMETMISPV